MKRRISKRLVIILLLILLLSHVNISVSSEGIADVDISRPSVKWKVLTGDSSSWDGLPTISSNDKMIFSAYSGFSLFSDLQDYLFAIDERGNIAWRFYAEPKKHTSSNILTKNEMIYVTFNNTLYSLNNKGEEAWRVDIAATDVFTAYGITSDKEGVIYVSQLRQNVGVRDLYAVNPDGTVRWVLNNISGSICDIGPDGNIYLTSNGHLHSISADGEILWFTQISEKGEANPPMVTEKGIYVVGDQALYSIDFFGEIKWSHELHHHSHRVSVDDSGRVYATGYVPGITPYKTISLICFFEDGDIHWIYDLWVPTDEFSDLGDVYSPLITKNTIFLSAYDKLVAISYNGRELWTYDMGISRGDVQSPPILGPGNVVYLQKAGWIIGIAERDFTMMFMIGAAITVPVATYLFFRYKKRSSTKTIEWDVERESRDSETGAR